LGEFNSSVTPHREDNETRLKKEIRAWDLKPRDTGMPKFTFKFVCLLENFNNY
jgi:hypothetical protein